MESASHINNLRALLNIKNQTGQTPYNILPIEKLNPKTCTYENLRQLMKNEESK
jgi:hypothetical protein